MGLEELGLRIAIGLLICFGAAVLPYRYWWRWKMDMYIRATLPAEGNLTTAEVVALVLENKRYRKLSDEDILNGLWRLYIRRYIGKVPTWKDDPERWQLRPIC